MPVTGGVAPVTLTAVGMPPGLTLNGSTGTITGSPTRPGNYPVTFYASDSVGDTGSATYPLSVALLPFKIAPAALPSAQVGAVYQQSLSGSGGSQTGYTWSILGSLPPGLAAKRNHRLHRMRTGDSRHSHHVGFVSDHSHAYGFSGRFGVGANYLDCGLWDASADTGSGSASGYHWDVLQLFLRRQRRNSPLHMEFQRQRTRPGASIGAEWNAERNSDSGERMSFWAQQHVVWRGHADPVQRSDVMNLSFVVSSGSDARTRLRDSGN